MNFGFSLYTIPLLVALVIYLKIRLGNLAGGKLLEGYVMCHCQHWRFGY